MTRQERLEKKQQAVRDEIKLAAWKLINSQGTAGLSMRTLAADLGLTATALYRYFESKSHLITALIVDAYRSLGQALDTALEAAIAAGVAARDWREHLRRVGKAYRNWALNQPAAFFLIFGDPIPDYRAPEAEVSPVASLSLRSLTQSLSLAQQCGDLRLPIQPPPSPELELDLRAWNDAMHHTHPDILYLSLMVAMRVQALMTNELGRQLPAFFRDGQGLYEREIERIILELSR